MASSLAGRAAIRLSSCRICHFVSRTVVVSIQPKLHRCQQSRWPQLLRRRFSSIKPLPQKNTVTLNFNLPNGEKKIAKAKIGDNILDVVIENDLDIDGFGACEGTLACSTCHLTFSPGNFDSLSDKATDEELDMLDLAYGLEDTSRLGCQVIVTQEMEGWEINIPAGIADAR